VTWKRVAPPALRAGEQLESLKLSRLLSSLGFCRRSSCCGRAAGSLGWRWLCLPARVAGEKPGTQALLEG